jgi:hypothetical protein
MKLIKAILVISIFMIIVNNILNAFLIKNQRISMLAFRAPTMANKKVE